ncbi:MAG: murein transglycosylase A [Desulfovermiculus sp.]
MAASEKQANLGWRMSRFLVWAMAVLVMAVPIACGPKKKPEPGLVPLSVQEQKILVQALDPSTQGLTSWLDLAKPVRRSLKALQARDGERVLVDQPKLRLTVRDIRVSLEHMLQILPELDADPELLTREFVCFELRPEVLFTGYYEPRLAASLEKLPGYPYPLYAPPQDLQSVDLGRFHPRWSGQRLMYRIEKGRAVPYHSRAEIDGQDVLQDKAEVVAWARDAVDVFFLHIQGSGKLQLPGGGTGYVGYAGKNGREYVSLGRVLVDKGYMSYDGLSMQSIRAFLGKNPELMPEILFTNPSYVFFQLRQDGPYGAMGRKLTPMVSLATDPALIPLGALLALQVDLPGKESGGTLAGLGLAQDVGGAIKGRHVDLFCGSGARAGRLAGRLKTRGRLYLLVSKTVLQPG